jgi:hypothetical protein
MNFSTEQKSGNELLKNEHRGVKEVQKEPIYTLNEGCWASMMPPSHGDMIQTCIIEKTSVNKNRSKINWLVSETTSESVKKGLQKGETTVSP